MKKKYKILIICIVIFLGIDFITGKLGYFKVYDNPTTANEPNLRMGTYMFVSNLKESTIGNFVCYRYSDEFLGDHIRVHRLCAKEHDTIEFRTGNLYVNGENFDKNLNLIHFYKINSDEFEELKNNDIINDNTIGGQIHKDTFLISIEKDVAKKFNLYNKRFINNKSHLNPEKEKLFLKNWTTNNFGPLVIPKNKFFVIGDNRDNSEDSRFIGLIDKEHFVGVVLNK